MTRTLIRNLMLVLALSLIGVACGDSSTGSGPSNGTESASVEGRVDNTSSGSQKTLAKVEGATVTAARVTSSGELEPLGNAETETSAEGEFTLEIDGDVVAESANRVVVIAEKNGQQAKAYVTAKVESGSTVEVQPITFESSSETSVYQEVIANGDAEVVSKADIEVMVNAEVAQDIESNSDHAADVAAALAAQAEAKARFYSEQGVEITEEQRENAEETKAQAQLQLESELNATTSTEEEQAAFDSFVRTVAKAETEANVNATAVAKASESSSRVLVKESANLSAEAQTALRKRAAYMATFALESSVEAQMKATGATESSVNSAVDAAATLRADIKAMSNATQEDIDAAFESFNSEIVAIMESDANVEGDLFASVNTAINENDGAKASFESSLEAAADLSVMMDAYTTFYSAIESSVDSTFTSASDAEVEAYTQLLILINVAS